MTRIFILLTGPEVLVGLLTLIVFAFCARHNSYYDTDVRMLERLIFILPVLVVLLAFAGLYLPGARTWPSLGRANLAAMIGLFVCAYRIVSGFAAPGSGPAGQDAALILALSFGLGLNTVANALGGVMVLRAQKPGVEEWYREHTVAGPCVTVLSMVPILLAQILAVFVIATVAGVFAGLIKR